MRPKRSIADERRRAEERRRPGWFEAGGAGLSMEDMAQPIDFGFGGDAAETDTDEDVADLPVVRKSRKRKHSRSSKRKSRSKSRSKSKSKSAKPKRKRRAPAAGPGEGVVRRRRGSPCDRCQGQTKKHKPCKAKAACRRKCPGKCWRHSKNWTDCERTDENAAE